MSLFVEQARKEGNNHVFLYVLGATLPFFIGQIIGLIPLIYLMFSKQVYDMSVLTHPEWLGVSKNTFLILMLLPFVCSLLLQLFWIKVVHKKRIITLLTAYQNFDWKRMFFAFALWFGLSAFADGVGYLMDPSNYEWHFNPSTFFILCLISILIIPLQTTFEELLFRSYLMQGIGMISRYRWIPLLITSVTFGSMHLMNPEVAEYGYITLWTYIGIGFLLGLLTILSDRMEFAIGLHAANNIYGSTISSFKGSVLTTDTLLYTKEMNTSAMSIFVFFLFMALYYFIIHKKYKLLPVQSLFEKY
jgi:uncharacterized protein